MEQKQTIRLPENILSDLLSLKTGGHFKLGRQSASKEKGSSHSGQAGGRSALVLISRGGLSERGWKGFAARQFEHCLARHH